MAVLTNAEKESIFRKLSSKSFGKNELKKVAISYPELFLTFQAIEDFWTANSSSIAANINTAAGKTLPNALIKKIVKSWLSWKWGGE